MEMNVDFTQVMNNQVAIRIALTNKMRIKAEGLLKTARNIGIDAGTLHSFIVKNETKSFKTLSKILNYLGDEYYQGIVK